MAMAHDPLNAAHAGPLYADPKTLLPEEEEQALLGALMCNPDMLWRCGKLKPEDFGYLIHGRIFAAMQKAKSGGSAFDPFTLLRLFKDDPDMPNPSYLSDLLTAVNVPSHAPEYAAVIIDYARRRRIVEAAREAIEAARGDFDVETSDIVAKLHGAAEIDDERPDEMTYREALEQLAYRLGRGGDVYKTGILALDRSLAGGVRQHRTYGVLAMNKAGKTALAGTLADNLNYAGVPMAYLAFEMGGVRIVQRMVSRRARISPTDMLYRPRDQVTKVMAYRADGVPDNLVFRDMAGRGRADLKFALQSLLRRRGIKGSILDGWQLVLGKDKGESLESHLRGVADDYAAFNEQHGLFGIILGQINDQGEGFGSKRGLDMACDWTGELHREKDGKTAWIENRFSRDTPIMHVGSETEHGLMFNGNGPYFEDMPDMMAPVELPYAD